MSVVGQDFGFVYLYPPVSSALKFNCWEADQRSDGCAGRSERGYRAQAPPGRQILKVDSNRLVSVCEIPSISRIRPSTRSKPSRLSARSSATMSQRPLVL